jgi:hypothetical protein
LATRTLFCDTSSAIMPHADDTTYSKICPRVPWCFDRCSIGDVGYGARMWICEPVDHLFAIFRQKKHVVARDEMHSITTLFFFLLKDENTIYDVPFSFFRQLISIVLYGSTRL